MHFEMVSSYIKFFLLVHRVYVVCQLNPQGCKAPSSSKDLIMVQRNVVSMQMEKIDAAHISNDVYGSERQTLTPVEDVMAEFDVNTMFREFQPAPDGGWESLDESERPEWYVSGEVLPPKSSKIALAFRGDFHRVHYHRGDLSGFSDYWMSKNNIYSSIVSPLESVGAQFRYYFHTYQDKLCPSYNEELIKDMNPTLYKFDEEYLRAPSPNSSCNSFRSSYSWAEVMDLVVEDGWADFAILLRFDVQYNTAINFWNVDWLKINVNWFFPHIDGEGYRNSDLLTIVPRSFFRSVLTGLQTYSGEKGKDGDRFDSGARTHFANFEGLSMETMHSIDPRPLKSDYATIPFSFCGIVRTSSKNYGQCVFECCRGDYRCTQSGLCV